MDAFSNWPALVIAFASLSVAFLGFRAAQSKSLKDDISGVEQRSEAGLRHLEEKMTLLVQGALEREAKSRHDLANKVQADQARMEMLIRQLDRDAARKEEMHAVERRLGESLAKFEAKLDRLGDGLSKMAAFDGNVRGLSDKMTWLAERIESLEVRAKRAD
ncbi:MAG TPA: hypothetical protein VNS22_12340 [Geminicoccus sp.]|uniref:hypothetical protein n=1 Tax=Geminicoccus sp. TaxID=2024832 RepID=UPI002B7C2615|nr:hypothetical protein [Geminicoccus sp.]HWL69161.1 hypothetical protein [Geminicoccus sp.]